MCNYKEKLYIHNVNRIAIAVVSVIAVLLDGVNMANCLYFGSAMAWLFLPECDAAEEHVLSAIKAGKERLNAQHSTAIRRDAKQGYTR